MSVLIRIFFIFYMINAALILSGFSGDPAFADNRFADAEISSPTDTGGALSMIKPLTGFFTGSGIMGMFTSSGIPIELQALIAIPLAAISLLLLAGTMASVLGFKLM